MTAEKIALVTGAGSGIGKAVAMALLADGYAVTLAGCCRERLVAASEESGAPNARCLAVEADVRDRIPSPHCNQTRGHRLDTVPCPRRRKYDIACGQSDIGNALTRPESALARGMPQANGESMVEPVMDVEDVVRAVMLMVSMPPSANVPFLAVMATKMPFFGRD